MKNHSNFNNMVENNIILCKKCGNPVQDGALFCVKCGAKVDEQKNITKCQNCNNFFDAIYEVCPHCGTVTNILSKGSRGCKRKWIGGCIALGILCVAVLIASVNFKENNNSANSPEKFSYQEKEKDSETVSESVNSIVQEEEKEDDTTTTATEKTPDDIPYSMDELNKAITAYNNYRNCGVCCEFDYGATVYGEAWEYMSSEQQTVATDLLTCSCCSSIAQAESHVGEYLADNMNRGVDPFVLVEYRGLLYCIVGQTPQVSFNSNDLQVSRTAYNKLSVTAGRYSSFDAALEGYTRIDFEFQNGTYKIVEATDLD